MTSEKCCFLYIKQIVLVNHLGQLVFYFYIPTSELHWSSSNYFCEWWSKFNILIVNFIRLFIHYFDVDDHLTRIANLTKNVILKKGMLDDKFAQFCRYVNRFFLISLCSAMYFIWIHVNSKNGSKLDFLCVLFQKTILVYSAFHFRQ